MKKIVLILFFTFSAFWGATSCGGDEEVVLPPPDLSVKDAAILEGTYKGNVKIFLLGIRKDTIYNETEVMPFSQSPATLFYATSELKAITVGKCWYNFKYAGVGSKDVNFNIGSHTKEWLQTETVPDYIKKWFKDYDTINWAKFYIEDATAKYVNSSKKITFSLEGKLDFNETTSGLTETISSTYRVRYVYDVTFDKK